LLPGERWFDPSRRSLAPHLPRSSSGRGRRSLTPEARVQFPLGVLHTARPRTRLETRPGCLPGEAGSTPVEGVLSRRSSVVSTTLLPWGTGVRLLPARLRRTARSEPPGCEPGKQGAIPWRRLCRAPKLLERPLRGRWLRKATALLSTTGRLGKHRSDTAVERGSIPRSSTFRAPPGPRPGPLAVGERPSRRFWAPEIAGSTPASQTSRGRGGAVLASLMSSRPWVRIPPALLTCGR
jgi:hypothetical protein